MDNLQTEVLELEFYEFSKGNIAITEVDFAKILLRYTYLVYLIYKRLKFNLNYTSIIFCHCFRILMNTICTWIVYSIASSKKEA